MLDVSVLILTIHDEEYYLKEFLKVGAKGFMVKTSTGRDLIHAIRIVHQKKVYIDPGLSNHMIASYLGVPPKKTANDMSLSKREREVFDKLIYGYTNDEAAKALSISKRTVESHRAAIMKKLDLKSRAEMVRYALQHGLLKP
jgi:two-component system response regulator NreC